MSLSDLFVRSEALPLLVAAPLAWLLLRLVARRRAARLESVVGPRVRVLAADVPARRRSWSHALFGIALLLGLVATLHPAWGAPSRARAWEGTDLVLCLDVSRSMRANDVPPDRLGRAQEEIRALVGRLEGGRVALVAFAGEARVVAPLTRDAASVTALAELCDPTSVARGGTDLAAAIEAALGLLEGGGARAGAIVLLTDGEDREERGLAVARRAAERGFPVHAVGIATRRGGKIPLEEGAGFLTDREGREVLTDLDRGSLERITFATGGKLVELEGSAHPLVTLYEQDVLPAARASHQRAGLLEREDRYQWPLLAALLLFLLDLALRQRGSP